MYTAQRIVIGMLAALVLSAAPVSAEEFAAASADEIAKTATQLKPGDTIVLKDGAWNDQVIGFTAKGEQDRPVTLRAQTPGKVVFTGRSSLKVDGEHIVISGFYFKDIHGDEKGRELEAAIIVPGSHVRVTECAVEGGTPKWLVHLIGREIRMDHCYLAEKASGDPTLQIEAPGEPNNDHIDHNHFGHRAPLGRNGGETIRIGYSGQSMNNSRSLVESNLFDRCDGELEIISSKSCENVYRYNTFLDCAGMFTLRHGNRCVVDSNVFLAHHKTGSGGVRVIGEGHVVTNNYIDAVDKGGFWVTAGVPNSELKEYFQAKDCVIAFNTVVDSAGPYLDLSA